jgi:RND superfamily putative drug exporter
MKTPTTALAWASARHPWRAIGVWAVLALLAIAAIAALLGGSLTTEGRPTNDPQSLRAEDVRAEAFPSSDTSAITDVVVVRSARYTTDEPEFEGFLERLTDSSTTLGASVVTPEPQVSEDGRALLVGVAFGSDEDTDEAISEVVAADADPAFAVSIAGDETLQHDFNLLSQEDLQKGEIQFGLPAALIILLLVFGAVVAGLVPLFMAIVSIVVALGIVSVIGQQFELSVFVVNMLTGMGLALGIDYSLFVVSRYREERGRGHDELGAITAAGATASRAVLFSGFAFVVAMFGMLLVPSSIMRSLAVGAIAVGVVSVAAATTLLPAVLGLLGDRVNALRIPFFGRKSFDNANPEGRFWGAIIRRVLRRPGLSFALSTAFLLLLAAPVLGLHTGANGVSTLPDRFAAKQGFVALAETFPGTTTDPVEVVVVGGASGPAETSALESVRAELGNDPRFGPGAIERSVDGEVAVLTVPVAGDPTSEEAVAAVRELRDDLLPAAFAGAGAEVLVGGATSENVDYFDSVIDPAPFVIGFVLLLTFVLLTIVFRSVVVAVTSVLLNLLSVGAAYGLLVLVFQQGVAADLLGFQQVDAIEAWVPLFLFSVLFGLSMDYQVFLLSRIKERHDDTGDTTDAVTFGVSSTARIITGAALIIVAVFAGFARGELVAFQQMGFGVAVALLIDATLIRSVLLPSVMKLLGAWNWYLPGWLEWLPEIHVEGHPPPPSPAGVAEA